MKTELHKSFSFSFHKKHFMKKNNFSSLPIELKAEVFKYSANLNLMVFLTKNIHYKKKNVASEIFKLMIEKDSCLHVSEYWSNSEDKMNRIGTFSVKILSSDKKTEFLLGYFKEHSDFFSLLKEVISIKNISKFKTLLQIRFIPDFDDILTPNVKYFYITVYDTSHSFLNIKQTKYFELNNISNISRLKLRLSDTVVSIGKNKIEQLDLAGDGGGISFNKQHNSEYFIFPNIKKTSMTFNHLNKQTPEVVGNIETLFLKYYNQLNISKLEPFTSLKKIDMLDTKKKYMVKTNLRIFDSLSDEILKKIKNRNNELEKLRRFIKLNTINIKVNIIDTPLPDLQENLPDLQENLPDLQENH